MDEVAIRFGLIAGALAVALLVTWVIRSRARRPIRQLVDVDIDPGTHFFSSRACDSCRSARRKLTEAVGTGGFLEHVWEDEPGVFAELGVDAVPAVLLVSSDGAGTLYPGKPDRAIAAL